MRKSNWSLLSSRLRFARIRDAAQRRDDAFTALAIAQNNYVAAFRHGCNDDTAAELTRARDLALAELIAADSDFHTRIDHLEKSRRRAS
jgi:hypothetical protein